MKKSLWRAPHQRLCTKVLAREVTTLAHGEATYEQALKISEALFSGDIKELNAEEIKQGFKDVPNYNVDSEDDLNIVELLVTTALSHLNVKHVKMSLTVRFILMVTAYKI